MARPPHKRQKTAATSQPPHPIRKLPDTKKIAVLKLKEELVDSNGKDSNEQPCWSSSADVSLASLIAPLDQHAFLQHCFRECAVHVPADTEVDRMSGVREELFDLDPESILEATSSESVFVWIQRQKNVQNGNLIQSIEVSDSDAALALYKAGHATYCRAPPVVEQNLVSSLLSGTGIGCGQYDPSGESITSMGRGEVEVFMSTPGHLTNWHFDFQENFTMQLSGVKEWTLQKGSVKHPLRGCTPHYQSPASVEPQLKAARLGDRSFQFGHPTAGVNAIGEQETVLVKPGDMLYFPAGMWHKVKVIEPGVSINISLMATNYASITCQALQHLLMQRDEWRECVTMNSASNALEKLKTLLDKLPSVLRDLEERGGAEAILPPAVREVASASTDRNSESDEEGEHEEIVDVTGSTLSACRYTEGHLRERLTTHYVVRNPLASLFREADLHKFFVNDGDAQAHDQVYVLNLNFAGNEAHESVVRIRMRGHGMLIGYLCSNESEQSPVDLLPKPYDWLYEESDRATLGFLVHHGYLVWRKRP